uniref:Uncharacterized protein n=1 Tax=Arundo donax TaxID=35708 RepID=A0A0A8YPR3_ARUDO
MAGGFAAVGGSGSKVWEQL